MDKAETHSAGMTQRTVEFAQSYNLLATSSGRATIDIAALRDGIFQFDAASIRAIGTIDAFAQAELRAAAAAKTMAAALTANQMARTAIISAQIAEERGDPEAGFRAKLSGLQRTTQAAKDANAEVGRDNERLAAETARAWERSASDTQSAWESAFDALKSKVSSVLSGALNVDVGVKADDLLPREDAINEDARRLADVAVNGFDSPWASYLNTKFPEMFGGAFEGGDIKTAAAKALKDFEDGLNPELIDKDKAKERVKRMIMGEASMAGLAAEITAELQKEMGDNAPADLADKVNKAIGAGGTGGADAGDDFAGTTLNAVVTSNVGGNMVATVVSQAAGKSALLKTSGASNGKLWGDAFLGTVREGVPGALIAILVSLVLPEVIAKLKAEKTKTGTVEGQ